MCEPSYARSTLTDSDVCVFQLGALSVCADGMQNGNELGVDCGGRCPPCVTDASQSSTSTDMRQAMVLVAAIIGPGIAISCTVCCIVVVVRRKCFRRLRKKSRHVIRVRPFAANSKVVQVVPSAPSGEDSGVEEWGSLSTAVIPQSRKAYASRPNVAVRFTDEPSVGAASVGSVTPNRKDGTPRMARRPLSRIVHPQPG